MKLDRLETHDRMQHFVKDQAQNVFQGAEDCMKINKMSLFLQDKSPYIYVFAHPRTDDDGVTKRMLWQARLTKPQAQENSYLFRAISKTDVMEVCWLIPPKELWPQYQRGNVTENTIVLWSINEYTKNRKNLEKNSYDDLPDKKIREIYKDFAKCSIEEKKDQAKDLGGVFNPFGVT